MNTIRVCQKCGAKLGADAPQGMCPACLLAQGLATETSVSGAEPRPAGFEPPTPEQLKPMFPQLEILELLGFGGMGIVYKVRQPQLDRIVALKILPPDTKRDPAFAERFLREARALARLNHPNIVSVFDFGQSGGYFYFLMEFMDGGSLRDLLVAQKLAPREALAVVPKVCEALQYAHDEGIVHRDIKPENILLDRKGRVKIADFGLAKLLAREPANPSLTNTGLVMGTPKYMAPEQIETPQKVDHRADIYALGVVLYEMLTGELPLGRFELPSHKVHVDVQLDEVVLRTLERKPERRYQHASEVKTDVEAIAARQPASPAPAPVAPTFSPEDAAARRQVRGPALGLVATALVNWFGLFAVVAFGMYWAQGKGLSQGALLLAVAILFAASGLILWGALKMLRLESLKWARVTSILAMVIGPGYLIGWPAGLWSLVVLADPAVKAAFRRKRESLTAVPSVGGGTVPPKFADDFILLNPRLPRMARAITVFCLLVAPALFLVEMLTSDLEGPRNLFAQFVHGLFLVVLGPASVLALGMMFIGGLKLRALRVSAPRWIAAAFWLTLGLLALGLVGEIWVMELEASNDDVKISVGEALGGVAGFAAIGFMIASLVWQRRHREELRAILASAPPAPKASVASRIGWAFGALIAAFCLFHLGRGIVAAPDEATVTEVTLPMHRGDDVRHFAYSINAPNDTQVRIWVESFTNGHRAPITGLDFGQVFTPAIGGSFDGVAQLTLINDPPARAGESPKMRVRWMAMCIDTNGSREGQFSDPFTGMTKQDSTWGKKRNWSLRVGQTATLLMLRGGRENLPQSELHDVQTLRQAERVIELKIRVEPAPAERKFTGSASQSFDPAEFFANDVER